ncbi:unnamed protein product [Mytilus coruscus]|uniref:Uncharacterized protein n=1 Tax=Mytilus coruscus TaxID=42192 RepID=A0A6J8C9W0_MYTCO|nr:unnamed protein product [Mytilus coruscus]
MTEKCLFSKFNAVDCGFSNFYNDTKQFYKLNECEKNTDAHLRSLHSYNLNSDVSESTLILSRVGAVFNYSCDYNICQAHRDTLGIYWQRSNRNGCKHPLHGSSKRKADRGISLKRSVEIFLFWGEHVPIGSGICRGCREDHSKELSKFTFLMKTMKNVPQAKKICLSSEVVCRLSVTDGNCLQYENCTTFEHVEDKSVKGSQDSQDATTIQGTASSQVTDSQTSDLFHDQLAARDKFNYAMNTISQDFTPLRSQLSHDWDILQRLVSYIAPDQEDKILPDVCIKLAPANYIQKDTLIDELIVAYIASNHSDIQIQILSIFANKYTKEELKKLVPDLTISKIDRARKHAALCGPGDVVKKEEIHRDRLTRAKIAHFLEFLSSPAYCQIVGFG